MDFLGLMTPRLADTQRTSPRAEPMPLYREVDWDFHTNRPIWRGGKPVICTGARAVLVWAWNAIHVERGFYELFLADYGQDIASLRGQTYTEEIRRSESIRMVREALLINPYITGVDQVDVALEGSRLKISFRLRTIYGEVSADGIAL